MYRVFALIGLSGCRGCRVIAAGLSSRTDRDHRSDRDQLHMMRTETNHLSANPAVSPAVMKDESTNIGFLHHLKSITTPLTKAKEDSSDIMRSSLKYPGWSLFIWLLIGEHSQRLRQRLLVSSYLMATFRLCSLDFMTALSCLLKSHRSGTTGNQLRAWCENGHSGFRRRSDRGRRRLLERICTCRFSFLYPAAGIFLDHVRRKERNEQGISHGRSWNYGVLARGNICARRTEMVVRRPAVSDLAAGDSCMGCLANDVPRERLK